MIGNAGNIPPIHPHQNQSISRPDKTHVKQFENPQLLTLIKSLGINPQHITTLSTQKGLNISVGNALNDIRVLKITPEIANMLSAIGIVNAELAIVIQSQEELKQIKKKLNLVKGSLVDKKTLGKLLSFLDLEDDLDTLGFTYEEGGLILIRSAFKETEESL